MNLLAQASDFVRLSLTRDSAFVKRRTPSIIFEINHSHSASRLLEVLSKRTEDIVSDINALAHLRVRASHLLLQSLVRNIRSLESYGHYFRKESDSQQSSLTGIYLRFSSSPSYLCTAEYHADIREAIENILDAFYQFIGLHMQTIYTLRLALRGTRTDELARTIISSCRQVSSLNYAISETKSAKKIPQAIQDVVQTCIFASRVTISEQMAHIAGQLGQFWNHPTSSNAKPFSAHDIRVTIQIIQRELADLPSTSRQLSRICNRDLAKPYDVQLRPVRYSGVAFVVGISAHALTSHTAILGGDGKLEEAVMRYGQMIRDFGSNNIVKPVAGFYRQIFHMSTSSESKHTVASSRKVLQEMLIGFTEQHLAGVQGAHKLAVAGNFKAVIEVIRDQAQSPLKNVLTGSLGQAMLLQVQKLKCDVEELMVKSKQLLRAQELNLALVALVPSVITVASLVYICSRLSFLIRSRNTALIVSGNQTARFLLGDVYSAFLELETLEEQDSRSLKCVLRRVKNVGVVHLKVMEVQDLVQHGVITAADKVLFRFVDDLEFLRNTDESVDHRRQYINRMLRCYPFLHEE